MNEIVTEENTKKSVINKVLKIHRENLTIPSENNLTKERSIDALMKVIDTAPEEAKLLSDEMFYTGTCVVRAGVHENLMPLKYQLDALGLNAKIYFNHVRLVLYIDYINRPEYTGDALEKVCGFSHETANNYAYKIFDYDFLDIKKGSYQTLKPLKDQLRSLNIGAALN
jgi:hypothetical protein